MVQRVSRECQIMNYTVNPPIRKIKRLNPKTKKLFKKGDKNKDGLIFNIVLIRYSALLRKLFLSLQTEKLI